MMNNLNYYKSFNMDNNNSIEKKCFNATGNYGFNLDSCRKNTVDYDSLCKKVTCKGVNSNNIKGKR